MILAGITLLVIGFCLNTWICSHVHSREEYMIQGVTVMATALIMGATQILLQEF